MKAKNILLVLQNQSCAWCDVYRQWRLTPYSGRITSWNSSL